MYSSISSCVPAVYACLFIYSNIVSGYMYEVHTVYRNKSIDRKVVCIHTNQKHRHAITKILFGDLVDVAEYVSYET